MNTGRAGRAPAGRYRFRNAARMEWVKLRTLRSTWWTLGITVAGAAGLGVPTLPLPHLLEPAPAGTAKMTGALSFRPARAWGVVLAWGELLGGLLLAVGLLTGIAAGVLLIDMIVAMWKVHWPKGFWVSKGGIEYNLTLATLFAVFGLAGPGAYAIDAPLGLASWTTTLFAVTLVLGLLGVWAGHRPEAARMEERRRRAA